jgi:hypothetical protein
MRILDIIVEDNYARDAVIDLLTVLAGEDTDSVGLDVLQQELSANGIDVDHNSLFDLLDNLVIVRNIKDDVVYFNTDSEGSHHATMDVDPDKQDKQIDKMARKQVSKEIKS